MNQETTTPRVRQGSEACGSDDCGGQGPKGLCLVEWRCCWAGGRLQAAGVAAEENGRVGSTFSRCGVRNDECCQESHPHGCGSVQPQMTRCK